MSRAMDEALKSVRSAARSEALMERPMVMSVYGYDLDRIAAAIDFFNTHAGILLDEVNLGGRCIIMSPDHRSAVDALKAHNINPKNPHLVIVTPDSKHYAYGWSRETPYTIISAPTRNSDFWHMLNELRPRFNNEPSDLRVACARVGVF